MLNKRVNCICIFMILSWKDCEYSVKLRFLKDLNVIPEKIASSFFRQLLIKAYIYHIETNF